VFNTKSLYELFSISEKCYNSGFESDN